MLEYKIKVKDYAAERDNFREEVVTTRVFGTETETVKSDELTEEDSTHIKQKTDTSKNKKAVVAFPDDEGEIKDILEGEAPYKIVGLLREVSSAIRGDTKSWCPPKGRYGITNQLQFWDAEISDVKIEKVKRGQFLQIHGNFNAKGSTLEYGDSVDFTATLKLWTPALDYDNAEPVVEKIVRLAKLNKFGPFRCASISFVG